MSVQREDWLSSISYHPIPFFEHLNEARQVSSHFVSISAAPDGFTYITDDRGGVCNKNIHNHLYNSLTFVLKYATLLILYVYTIVITKVIPYVYL